MLSQHCAQSAQDWKFIGGSCVAQCRRGIPLWVMRMRVYGAYTLKQYHFVANKTINLGDLLSISINMEETSVTLRRVFLSLAIFVLNITLFLYL